MHLLSGFRREHPAATGVALLAIAALGVGVAFAASSDQDPSFNGGTALRIEFPGPSDRGTLVAVAPDKTLIVAGGGYEPGEGERAIDLARVSAGGALVDEFGDHGIVEDKSIKNIWGASPEALAIAPDGHIFVGLNAYGSPPIDNNLAADWGTSDTDTPGEFTVARYTAAGARDGLTRIDLNSDPYDGHVSGLVAQDDGKVLVAGWIIRNLPGVPVGDTEVPDIEQFRFAVARLRADGTLDPDYGQGGYVVDNGPGSVDEEAIGAGHQPNGPAGSIVVAGTAHNGDVVLRRFLADGSIDETFGGQIPKSSAAPLANHAFAIGPDGAIYVGSQSGFEMRRYSAATGEPDLTWGTDGVSSATIDGSSNPSFMGITLQPDGMVLGLAQAGGQTWAARFTSTGQLDTTYGTDGSTMVDFNDPDVEQTFGEAIAMQPDGKPVIAGWLGFVPGPPGTIAQPSLAASARRTSNDGTLAFVARLGTDDVQEPITTTETTPTVTVIAETQTTTTTTTTTTTATTTATPAPVSAAPITAAPVRALSLPSARRCISRRSFKIRLRIPRGGKPILATVKVNGRQVKVVKGARLKAGINLTGLPKGRFTVGIAVKLADGKSLNGQRRYRTCTPKRPGGVPKL
jgi:uncharacterized delta-60 repeat protein